MDDLTEAKIQDILQSVPPPQPITVTPRHVYFVVGKPGSGKSSIAAKLAAHSETKLISPETLLNNILLDEQYPNRQEVFYLRLDIYIFL